MSFLAPIFLGALALILAPLLIHLLRRRKMPVVRWAAMEFLLQSQRKQRKRLRIEELILLALRILLVVLAVLAFARPVLHSLTVPILSQNARIYAVVIVDDSFGMGQTESGGKTAWQHANADAVHLITHVLQPGDQVSVLLADSSPAALQQQPSFDLHAAARRLSQATLSDRGPDTEKSAQKALDLLERSKAPYKEVYWFTSGQKDAWPAQTNSAAHTVWSRLGREARIVWVTEGPPSNQRGNLSVRVLPPARELVTPNLPARIETRVSNFSTQPRSVTVQIALDGNAPAAPQTLKIAPESSQTAVFSPYFPTPGTHIGVVELQDPAHADSLPIDNSAPFVIQSRDRIPVLIQDMSPAADPTQSSSFFLDAALQPGRGLHVFAPQLLTANRLGSINLQSYAAVVITGLNALSANEYQALASYVQSGGGLLIFPGTHTPAAAVNKDLQAAGLLPARLGPVKSFSQQNAPTLDSASIHNDPALSLFKDSAILNLGSAHFTAYRTLTPLSDPMDAASVHVMLRLSNHEPALVERSIGTGEVMLFASTADTRWNDLPARGAWLPLLYQLLSQLAAGPNAHRNLHEGEPLRLSLPLSQAGKPVRVLLPSGKSLVQSTVLGPQGVALQFSQTEDAGFYRVVTAGSHTPKVFAVGLPANGSNLQEVRDPAARLSAAGVDTSKITVVHNPQQLASAVQRARYGSEIGRSLAMFAIALLFLESLLARWFGRRG